MGSEDLLREAERYLMSNYSRAGIVLSRGEGARVWDVEGKEYLDFVTGIAVNLFGHGDRRIVSAIREQAGRLIHVSNLWHIDRQIEAARLLVESSFAGKVFFCNSGAEANEAAIKIARKWAKAKRSPEVHEIIVAEGSFHGRTYGALSATMQKKYHEGFDPLLPGFVAVPFDDPKAIEKVVGPKTAAVLLEPIQGEGGLRFPSEGYLAATRRICDREGILLVLDEVQTGLGRTGRMYAYEHYGIEPDVMTLAKALGGGFPIGAMIAKEHVAEIFTPGSHASTFGGNPLACSAAIAVLTALKSEPGILKNATEMGTRLVKKLTGRTNIKEVRAMGLLVGVEIAGDARKIVERGLAEGILLNAVAENVLRLVPPLTIGAKDIDRGAEMIAGLVEKHG